MGNSMGNFQFGLYQHSRANLSLRLMVVSGYFKPVQGFMYVLFI